MTPVPAAAPAPRKLGYADYLLFPDDHDRHELVDGDHFVSPSPRPVHQRISAALFRILDPFVRENHLGEMFYAPLDVVLSDHDVLVPDLIFVSRERAAIITDTKAQGAPDLVVEILSPGTRQRDETLKRERYGKLGVLEYWMVDPDARNVRVVRWAPEWEQLLGSAEKLTSPLFPGLEIPVHAVFTSGVGPL